eukprot:m.226487 g.226487  ORF g.226487 m.226487 type:complete len:366 (-) comp16958_c0_seq1:129-1226(-)
MAAAKATIVTADGVRSAHFRDHNTNPITLSRFIMDAAQLEKGRSSLSFILQSIGVAAKVIANAVQKAGAQGLHGLVGEVNKTGDDQKKLDVLANDVMINALIGSKKVSVMVSEENEDPMVVDGVDHARYAVVFDPLDGSSNIECNVSVGTIFGIYHQDVAETATLADALQPGKNMVAAGYVLYSSSVVMMLSFGTGLYGFTLDPNYGEFVMSHEKLRFPDKPKQIYSVNTGNSELWDEPTKAFVRWTKEQKTPYSGRYIGSMVSDVHRTILYGGIFMYPADKKSKNGKLRLLYECFPMAYLVEQAGGVATDGRRRILDIQPKEYHERSPIFLGCARDVEKLMEFYATVPADADSAEKRSRPGPLE